MKLTATVDRIEEQYAVLLVGEPPASINWPVALLPEPVQEGDVLTVEWQHDRAETEKVRDEAAALLAELLGGEK